MYTLSEGALFVAIDDRPPDQQRVVCKKEKMMHAIEAVMWEVDEEHVGSVEERVFLGPRPFVASRTTNPASGWLLREMMCSKWSGGREWQPR